MTAIARRLIPATAITAAALASLAACSAESADANNTTSSTAASSSTDSSAAASASTSSSSGASGTWTESGDYQSPGGAESVKVTLTAKDGTVTAVTVVGTASDPTAQRYQSQFISGIKSAVVGKKLATLSVGAVSGSSLTGNGFNAAVVKIRADAA